MHSPSPATCLFLVRHATPLHGGRLAGRRDIEADCSNTAAFRWLRSRLPERALLSPARRCQQTAAALGLTGPSDPALWEQDYGAWEGQPFAALPDLGNLPPQTLAAFRPPGGESFNDMAARAIPALSALNGDVAVIAHAGTVRAALSLAVGPAALSFAVAPLSLTILRRAGSAWAIDCTNLGYEMVGGEGLEPPTSSV